MVRTLSLLALTLTVLIHPPAEARTDSVQVSAALDTQDPPLPPPWDDGCGYCDGLCVDGKCLMDLGGLYISPELFDILSDDAVEEVVALTDETSEAADAGECGFCDGICVDGMCIMEVDGYFLSAEMYDAVCRDAAPVAQER